MTTARLLTDSRYLDLTPHVQSAGTTMKIVSSRLKNFLKDPLGKSLLDFSLMKRVDVESITAEFGSNYLFFHVNEEKIVCHVAIVEDICNILNIAIPEADIFEKVDLCTRRSEELGRQGVEKPALMHGHALFAKKLMELAHFNEQIIAQVKLSPPPPEFANEEIHGRKETGFERLIVVHKVFEIERRLLQIQLRSFLAHGEVKQLIEA